MEVWHRPVLLNEVVENIKLFPGGDFADLTFGEGGHTETFLKKGVGSVWAVDRDPLTLKRYREEGAFREDPRLTLSHSRFSKFPELSKGKLFDGILVDLGVSTRQLLEPERGFTFQKAAPLDMRMNPQEGMALSDWLAEVSEEELAEALEKNTDMLRSRGIARRILRDFSEGKIKTTADLAKVMGPQRPGKSHPATVLFMALRMAINEELEEIENTFPKLLDCLKPGGRLVVLTFHSTEDRKVKRLFQELAGRCICGERLCLCPRVERVKILTKKPLEPSEEELKNNPRSRSAKLRAIEKI